MTQPTRRVCPHCNAPLLPDQRFCSNCGKSVDLDSQTQRPTSLSDGDSGGAQRNDTPPPPPLQPYANPSSPQMFEQRQYPPAGGYQPQPGVYQPQPGGFQQPPSYVRPQKDSTKGVLGQIGCGVGVVILLILALCGGLAYWGYTWVSNATKDTARKTTTSYPGGSSSGEKPTAVPTPTVTKLTSNNSVLYAGVKITVLDVQQSTSFVDDTNSEDGKGILRLSLEEDNTLSKSSRYYYGDVMRLLLPDNTNVAPGTAKDIAGPDASTKRRVWVDFPVALNTKVSDITLRLGKPTEAQIDLPLNGNGDLKKYAPVVVQPNKKTTYADLNWTITDATLSWNNGPDQAESGKRYVTLKMSVDNPTKSYFSRYSGDYFRLKAGNATSSPDSNSDFPTGFEAGSSGKTGTLVFEVPQGVSSFTLVFLASSDGQNKEKTSDFTIS